MNERFNQELSQRYQEVCRLEKITISLSKLREELNKTELAAQVLEDILQKETSDYEKLGKMSFSTILYSLLGKLEEKTEAEKQEMLQASLRYKQFQKNLEGIKSQINDLESEKLTYCNSKREYEQLYQEKLQYLQNQHHPYAQVIMELNQKLEESKHNQLEIGEALSLGEKIRPLISKIEQSLGSAENWGSFDLFAGGMVSSMIKHSHLDEAGNLSEEINSLVKQFQLELSDINISEEIVVSFSDFEKFADLFFDGIFVDWYILDKINDSKATVASIKNQIESLIQKLIYLSKEEYLFQEQTKEKIEKLVVEA